MTSGSFASNSVETVRLLDPTCHNFRTLSVRNPRNRVTKYPLFLRNTLTPAPRNNVARYIHLSGGRIEAHFHIFGSLAFLAFYRDWRVLVTGSVVVVADHLLRGVFWPESIFGVNSPDLLRALEHGGWVVFEDIFLFLSIRQSLR